MKSLKNFTEKQQQQNILINVIICCYRKYPPSPPPQTEGLVLVWASHPSNLQPHCQGLSPSGGARDPGNKVVQFDVIVSLKFFGFLDNFWVDCSSKCLFHCFWGAHKQTRGLTVDFKFSALTTQPCGIHSIIFTFSGLTPGTLFPSKSSFAFLMAMYHSIISCEI